LSDILLKIVVNEQQQEKKSATCKKILSFLKEQGIPGATMRRAEAGLDYHGNINYDILEDTYFNDLPIIIESVFDNDKLEKLEEGLERMTGHGQISLMKGADENAMEQSSHFIVKIYTKENSRLIKKDEYEKILQLLKKHKAIWATVTKAIAGYGRDGIIYGQHIFSLSEHVPLIIECIVDREHLKKLMTELEEVVLEGAVFIVPAEVAVNK